MKYLKKFETGEWLKMIDWDYVKDHPENESDEALLIRYMEEKLEEIHDFLEDASIFKIIDIRGYDTYQGPYAIVSIFNKKYKIWLIENEKLWIENFPINNSDPENKPGYDGYTEDISTLLNNINNIGSIDDYQNIEKYNL